MELGINDLLEIEVVDAYETVIRGILELESRPAVINIEWAYPFPAYPG
jgi:hypothetical protein